MELTSLKTLFIDFDDSFSFNVIAELYSLGIRPEIFLWDHLEDVVFGEFDLIVLGPGPGKTSEYSAALSQFKEYFFHSNRTKYLGICLGHQILLELLGAEVSFLKNKVHGQSRAVEFDRHHLLPKEFINRSFDVQFYNSQGVFGELETDDSRYVVREYDDSILAYFSDKLVTFQFHPESVGTSCRQLMFSSCLKKLYNR